MGWVKLWTGGGSQLTKTDLPIDEPTQKLKPAFQVKVSTAKRNTCHQPRLMFVFIESKKLAKMLHLCIQIHDDDVHSPI